MPMEVGNTWTYTVTSELSKYVARLKVSKEAPVAGVTGYELSSDLGLFRLAWKNGVLVADSLAGTRFDPPLPLVRAGKGKSSDRWSGMVSYLGRTTRSIAEITQDSSTIEIGSKKMDCARVVTKLSIDQKNIEIESCFVPGIGLVEQSQHVDGLLTIGLKYQEGPKNG
jgi:hypothetical protein